MADPRYKDLDLDFIPHPVTKDIVSKINDEAVKRSIRNLVLLNTYEKPFHPEIGSDVRNLLFELATPLTAIRLKKAIEEVIENFEPRVNLTNIDVTPKENQNAYYVSLKFFIINEEVERQTTFMLERTR